MSWLFDPHHPQLRDQIFWKAVYTAQQQAFRGRNDTVGLNVDTWTYALNTNWTQAFNANFRVRFLIQETGGADGADVLAELQYSIDGGSYATVTTTSPVKLTLTSQYAQNDLITTSLIGGTGTLDGSSIGKESPSGLLSNSIFPASSHWDIEFCLQLDSAQISNGAQVRLQVVATGGGAFAAATNIPVISAGTGGASFAAAQNAYRFAEDGTESGATLIGSLNTPLSRTL